MHGSSPPPPERPPLPQDRVRFLFGERSRPPRLLDELLPGRFGPQDLMEEPFPLLMQPHSNRWGLGLTIPPS